MNILMLHPHDLRFDPWTIRILELGRHLALRGHWVTLCYVPKRKVEPHNRLIHPSLPNEINIHPLGYRHGHLFSNTRLIARLARVADVVHIQKCFPSVVVPGLWAAYLRSRPVHYDWDDHESAIARLVEERTLIRTQIHIYERCLPGLVDTITYSSEGIHRLARDWGFPEDRMWWAPVGANLERFTPSVDGSEIRRRHGVPQSVPVILYVGQLEGAAYPELPLHAMQFVHKKFPEAVLWIVGGGKGLDRLRRACRDFPRSSQVLLLDYVPHQEIPRHLAAATVCVASFEENPATACKSPLKVVEYLSAGKAIVASAVGEVTRMLDSCGVLVHPGDPEALAIGICGFLEDEQFRQKYQRLARKKAEEIFNWEWTVDILETAYRRAIELHR